MNPQGFLKCANGVQSLKWTSDDTMVAGCTDHQLKVFDMYKLQVVESLFTNHKVVTCLDASLENPSDKKQVVLGGHEDGTVRLFDLRASSLSGVRQHKVFECHSVYISQVKICPNNANVFLTSAYDGKVKMWDLRSEHEPLAVLKRATPKDASTPEDFKQFALNWSFPTKDDSKAQILSGGSDSHIAVHSLDLPPF